MIGVYKITSPEGKIYIGASRDIDKRIIGHRHISKQNIKNNKITTRLQKSFSMFCFHNHTFEVIEECSIEELRNREGYWQLKYDVIGENGLNLLINKGTGNRIVSPELNAKRSAAREGRPSPMKGRKVSAYSRELWNNTHIKNYEKNHKKVINMSTGIFYDSVHEASIAHNININTLKSYLSGNRTNKTDLIYAFLFAH